MFRWNSLIFLKLSQKRVFCKVLKPDKGIKMGIGSVLNSMLVLPKRIDIPLTDDLTNEIRCR